jgi:chorismate synthase
MSNTFGSRFRVTTFGESHAPGLGAVIDGCPARLELTEDDIQPQLNRRRPGQSDLTTPRNEKDMVRILSGTANGRTLGTPLCLVILNHDQRPHDYAEMTTAPRPSHADYTTMAKYGIMAPSGGGRASARETAARVAAGAVAEKFLRQRFGVEIVAWVSAIHEITAPDITSESFSRDDVDSNAVRCPHLQTAEKMETLIRRVKAESDSVGGIVTCVCRGVPTGLGEPVFNKTEALLAQAMLSIPAAKGFEVGSGFSGTRLRGSAHNDRFIRRENGKLGTATNRSGGIQGGITNGENIIFRVAFKPTATIGMEQQSVDFGGDPVTVAAKGRHDPCVLPRAVPIVESMAALTLADLALIQYNAHHE